MAKKKKKKPAQLSNLLILALLRKPKTPRDEINRAYAIDYWRRCRGKKTRLSILLNFLLSPGTILRDMVNTAKKYKDVEDITLEKGRIKRFFEEFYLAFFYSIHPEDYYLQRFYKRDGLERAKYYYNKGVLKHGVYKLLLRYGQYKSHHHKEIYSLGNKEEFFAFCTKKKLQTIPVELEFLSDGSIKDHTGRGKELPEKHLFLKPTFDKEGQGAESWFWKEQVYENIKGESLDKEALMTHIKKLAKDHERGSILIQPLVLPHRELSMFRKNASPTLRLITYRNKAEKILLGIGMFRFTLEENSVVDNASAGGMMAPIDIEKGILGGAMYSDLRVSNESIENFPEQNIQVKGREIPYWKESVALVKRAHKYYPERYIIGWDILITDEGPLLVEGNAQPGIDFIQRTHGHSIGEFPIGKDLGKHAKKAINLLYSGKLRKNLGDPIEVDLYQESSWRRWKNWVFLRETVAIEVRVEGKVQRVGFRRWLEKRAKFYHVKGWCENRPDGSLRGVFIGKSLDVEDLYRECYRGPERAKVEHISVKAIKPTKETTFSIKK